MPESKKHKDLAKKFERATNLKYNKGKGADFKGPKFVAEIEPDESSFAHAAQQLQGYKGPVYVVTPNEVIPKAVKRFKKTTIGVRKASGTIVKQSTRKRK